jgi:hypothetical protein
VRRDGVVALPPETLALLNEGTGKGLRYIVPLTLTPQLNDGVSFQDYLTYVVTRLSGESWKIEVPAEVFAIVGEGQPDGAIDRARLVRHTLGGRRRYMIGGLLLDPAKPLPGRTWLGRSAGLSLSVVGVPDRAALRKRVAALRKASGRPDIPVYVVWQDGPGDPQVAAKIVARWTIEALAERYCNLWWHATRDSAPLFGFHRQEEPTMPFYTLRLLATLLKSAPARADAAEIRAIGAEGLTVSTCHAAGSTRLLLVDAAMDLAGRSFDLVVPKTTKAAKLIDLLASTSQLASLESRGGSKVLPNLVWPGYPIVIALTE